jgi:hypothetical protein
MSITVDLTEQELAELRAFTNQAEANVAVRSAMIEYLRLAKRLQLKAMSGQVEMEDNWQSLEAAELKEQNGNSGTGTR